jgi:tripartite-type tricarboxylate transporter receptor subunit TctC
VNGALRRAGESPQYVERLAADGLTVSVGTPEQMTQFLREEQARWGKVVTQGKISVD